MTPRDRRLERLEFEHLRRWAATAGAPLGVSADHLLHELGRYLACPDDRMAAFEATLSPEERQEVAAMKARYRRILGRGRRTR